MSNYLTQIIVKLENKLAFNLIYYVPLLCIRQTYLKYIVITICLESFNKM